ncbi:MAG: hypothetical protein ACLP1Y_08445 [Candidatus Acidiferrales bacterium]
MEKKRIRVKKFEHDGASYTIGALSFKQVRELFGEGKKSPLIELAAASLQAGEPDENWTVETIKEAFDPIGFQLLVDDISEFNGLGLEKPEGGSPAADSTSSSSAAAS